MNESNSPSQALSALRWGRLVWMLCALSAGVLAIGLYPTWRWSGLPGMVAAICAVSVDFLLLIASGAIVCHWAKTSSAAKTAQLFLAAGMARMVLLLAVGQGLIWALALPLIPYWAWAALVYVPMLMAEVVWAGKGLGHAHIAEVQA